MGFFTKLTRLFHGEKGDEKDQEEIGGDLIDVLEDELNFEDRSAGIYRVDLKDTKRLKAILSDYDFEHEGVDEKGAVIIDDGGTRLKIEESGDKLRISDAY